MDSQVLPDSWGGLSSETEIILTKQPNAAALTVVFRVRDPELRWLKLFPTAVTTGFYHFELRFVWKTGHNHPGLSWHQLLFAFEAKSPFCAVEAEVNRTREAVGSDSSWLSDTEEAGK